MPEQKLFTLEVTEQEVAIIGESLSQVAFKLSAPVIQKIQTQINAQLKTEVKAE